MPHNHSQRQCSYIRTRGTADPAAVLNLVIPAKTGIQKPIPYTLSACPELVEGLNANTEMPFTLHDPPTTNHELRTMTSTDSHIIPTQLEQVSID